MPQIRQFHAQGQTRKYGESAKDEEVTIPSLIISLCSSLSTDRLDLQHKTYIINKNLGK